jgi:hypothetical protein
VYALAYFGSYTGLYNTFRHGVLTQFYTKSIKADSEEIQVYIELYEKYVNAKLNNNQEDIKTYDSKLKEIEDNYRTNIIYYLRKVLNDKIYGLIL